MKPTGKCVFCGDTYQDFGNNPDPLTNKGRCCDWCNAHLVVALRLRLYYLNK